MKKNYVIKYLRVGSKLINKHSGKIYVVISKSKRGFKLLEEGKGLPTSELRTHMGLYFKKACKNKSKI